MHLLKMLLLAVTLVAVLGPEWPAFGAEQHRLRVQVGQRGFDFVRWELNALAMKLGGELAAGHTYMDQAARKEFVLAYLELVREVRRAEARIEAAYTDPEIANPDAATADLQAEAAAGRAEMERRRPVAEAIVQEQVAAVLVEEGFGVLNEAWPPVQMTMTPLPLILVVSPRDDIRQKYGIPLAPGMPTPERETLEENIYEELDLSALVVPIGGLGIYPAMIIETSDINYLADVVAHEWAHHWLTLHPLGLGYAASPQLRTINETVASVIGTEVGARVVERYYPEFVPPPVEPAEEPDLEPGGERPFDFRAEMAETRVQVDLLLAEGEVDAAEFYMEARRRYFVSQGYNIRKLNQAYFAFYGAYADTPGASGGDPIGPTVLAIRELSGSLRGFMDNVANVTSFEELQEVLVELGG